MIIVFYSGNTYANVVSVAVQSNVSTILDQHSITVLGSCYFLALDIIEVFGEREVHKGVVRASLLACRTE